MVEIVPYQTNWPAEFQAIAARLRSALGDLALRLDHIGSTSVPGLPAKDIIDVQITVAALTEPLRSAMLSLGYSQPGGVWRDHCPPNADETESEWEKWFFFPPPG